MRRRPSRNVRFPGVGAHPVAGGKGRTPTTLWELMRINSQGAQTARGRSANITDGIGSMRWTNRGENATRTARAQIGLDAAVGRAGGHCLLVFQSPLLFGTVDLAKVVDAGIGLGGGAGLHEIWNGDCSQ